MSGRLRGKVALVTGAGARRGIGWAIALGMAREGAKVALADIDLALALEKEIPLGILENLFECLDLIKRLKREAAILLPSHDPAVLSRHPGGRIP